MDELSKTQTCPYCDTDVEECHAEWEEGDHIVNCDCGNEYSVEPVYEFKGFRTQKICAGCSENEEDCYCDEEEANLCEIKR